MCIHIHIGKNDTYMNVFLERKSHKMKFQMHYTHGCLKEFQTILYNENVNKTDMLKESYPITYWPFD